jgi:TolA-binding protein
MDEKERAVGGEQRQIRVPLESGQHRAPASRKVMWALVVLVLVAGAFYAGLRASNYFNRKPEPDAGAVNVAADLMRAGREAFDRGDYRGAIAEFDSLARREPMNAKARYWLGRAQLEAGEYQQAAQNFDEVTRAQPSMHEAYLHAAAAYEAMGNRLRAAQMLDAYGDRRREQPPAAVTANTNSPAR